MLDNYAEMEAREGGDTKHYEMLLEMGAEAKLSEKVTEEIIKADVSMLDTKKSKKILS
jgi:hypothetical protein